MKLVKDYLVRIAFATGILLGVQMPNFMDQYARRIDAHYLEVRENLSGYRAIADQHHGGSLRGLIEKHERSVDPTFRAEALPIKALFHRELRFKMEADALNSNLFLRTVHVVFKGDREVMGETYRQYSPTVPLNVDAVACGIITGVLLAIFCDALCFLLRVPFQRVRP